MSFKKGLNFLNSNSYECSTQTHHLSLISCESTTRYVTFEIFIYTDCISKSEIYINISHENILYAIN